MACIIDNGLKNHFILTANSGMSQMQEKVAG
jgi:hypothetical protein